MTALRPHSLIAHSAYHDLKRLHLDDEASELRGTVVRKERAGRLYLYDQYRLGSHVVSRYLGEGTPERLARLDRAEAIRAAASGRRREQARLARLLRTEGLPGLDVATGSLMAALARIGVFRLGGTVVGTVAFRLYEAELGVRLGSDVLTQTGDVDLTSFERLSIALGDTVTDPVAEVLGELRFDPVPSLEGRKVWKWRDQERQTMIEFLTPSFGEEGVRDLPALGVSAQGLHYLNYLLAEPIKAVALYRSGLLVQAPRPERYAIHKLIVADRRRDGTDSAKSAKDRAQASALIDALAETRPDDLLEAWEDARSRGPRWRERLDRTLGRMPAARARLEALA